MEHTDLQTGTADVAAAIVERFGPPPTDHGRARKIAAIHAYAQWLADNPDVPMPTHVHGTTHQERTVSEAESLEVVERFARHTDARKLASGGSRWAVAEFMDVPGLRIDHTVFVNTDPASDTW
jgi:hypothetical protein